MKRRWTAPNRKIAGMKSEETIDQRITLVDSGRKMLVSSDRETRFIDLATERDVLVKSDFGSFFGVPNPIRTSLVMLVKRSGAVRLFDLQQPESWEKQTLQEYSLAGSSEMPLRGAWSADGRRFYLAFSAGGLAAYELSGDRLRLTWSNRKLEDDPQAKSLRNALQVQNGRVQSHLDLDLIVTEGQGGDEVYVASRSRDLAGSTKLVTLNFAGADPTLVEQRVENDVRWLQVSGGQVKLSDRLHDSLVLDVQRIRSRQSLNARSLFRPTPRRFSACRRVS